MKDIRPALRAFLLGDPTVSDLVGGGRIHPTRLPQGQVEPSVVYTKISEVGDYNMATDSGLSQIRMQLDAWAQTPDQATSLADAVHDRLSGARGPFGVVDVRGSFVAGGREDYDEIAKMFRVQRDYIIWYGAST